MNSPNVKSLWVFGYGSLLWSPGFAFSDSVQGVVKGYARKFWQGNVTHRGTPSLPGRVATLVEDSLANVWGVAYELCGEDAIAYLDNREVSLGGYVTKFVKFYPERGNEPFPVLLYIATPESAQWLGHAPEEEIAEQIVSTSGTCGHNVEYIIRLAEYVRSHAPQVDDCHLYTLESHVRRRVVEKDLDLDRLMGGPISEAKLVPRFPEDEEVEPEPAPVSFMDLLEQTKLRCLGI